jgi:hypothetical protein
MKIILSEVQLKKIITEALGVPDSVLDAAEVFYEIFLNKLKTINTKEKEYEFQGYVNISLGGKDKIKIRDFELRVEIDKVDDFDRPPVIHSMGMKQTFNFDRDIMMKKTEYSNTAEFTISFAVGENWEPEDLYNEFSKNKASYISSLAHEIKHKYDKQIKRVDLIGREAEYYGLQKAPRFQIDVIDKKFFHYLYFTDIAESLVRPTEVASRLRSSNITQDQFREFLSNDETYKKLIQIKNFTFDDLAKGILNEIDKVDELIRFANEDPENMTDEEKVEIILTLVYVNLTNTKFDSFKKMVNPNPMLAIYNLFRGLGGHVDPQQVKVDKLIEKFYNYLIKYKNNPVEYFKAEIENFHYIANKMIKKIAKLYAMTPKSTNESILDWDLNEKVKQKKEGIKPIDYDFKKLKKHK